MPSFVRRALAEMLGTFVLLSGGGLAILSVAGRSDDPLAPAGLLVIGFGFGLALLAGLYAFGEISGGHFNPAVSLAALLDGRISPFSFAIYLVAQVAGAVLAGLVLLAAADRPAVAATATVPGIDVGPAFLLEVLLTAVFVAVILKVTSGRTTGGNAFLAIPLTLVAIHLAAVPLSGASVNPARTLGSAIVGDTYGDVWIYLTAPFLGAALGWLAHQLLATGTLRLPRPGALRRRR